MSRLRKNTTSDVEPRNALKIYAITDTHVLSTVDGDKNANGAMTGWSDIGGRRFFYTGTSKLRSFIKQVNIGKPDLVLHCGDMIESGIDSLNLFKSVWESLDGSLLVKESIGNHDLAGVTYQQIVSEFGYSNRPINAGSVFNHSFSLSNEHVSVRVVMADTNILTDGSHAPQTPGTFTTNTLEWIKGEMLTCAEDVVLLITHHGAHTSSDGHFNADNAILYKSMINEVTAQRTNLKIHYIFGHRHIGAIEKIIKLGSGNLMGYNLPAAINREESFFTKVYILPDKSIKFKLVRIS